MPAAHRIVQGAGYSPAAGERLAVLVCGANTTAVNFD
jgi:threonine dehydratase